jgi:hypothetical protein
VSCSGNPSNGNSPQAQARQDISSPSRIISAVLRWWFVVPGGFGKFCIYTDF